MSNIQIIANITIDYLIKIIANIANVLRNYQLIEYADYSQLNKKEGIFGSIPSYYRLDERKVILPFHRLHDLATHPTSVLVTRIIVMILITLRPFPDTHKEQAKYRLLQTPVRPMNNVLDKHLVTRTVKRIDKIAQRLRKRFRIFCFRHKNRSFVFQIERTHVLSPCLVLWYVYIINAKTYDVKQNIKRLNS